MTRPLLHASILILVLLSCIPSLHAKTLNQLNQDRLFFEDDLDKNSLLSCAQIHKKYIAGLPESHTLTIADKSYTKHFLLKSLERFIAIVSQSTDKQELSDKVRKEFNLIHYNQIKENHYNSILVTGYYEPSFAGSLTYSHPYIHPLYRLPNELIFKSKNNKSKKIGRIDQTGNVVPFWTRAEIETSNPLQGYELVYLRNRFEAFLLHIQGSGRIRFPNGSEKAIRYAGNNGHKYKSIGKLLIDEGKLTREDASIPTIRDYYENHPEEQTRILHHNPRFIFFSWDNGNSPKGSLGLPLTAGRSIAIDQTKLPRQLPGWLSATKPLVGKNGKIERWVPFNRFVFPQDSGAGVKGAKHIDLFMGHGQYAEIAAGNMKQQGSLFFLILKDDLQ